MDNTERLARRLAAAERDRAAVAPIAAELGEGADIAAAYAVQEANTRHALASGRRLSGRKIGLTSRAVQAQLGVDQPDYGMLFADMEHADDDELPFSRLIQPRIEAEIAFVLERDLPDPDVTPAEVIRAVAFALPAIEVVDSRIENWRIGILDTVADNASSGLYVLGNTPVPLAAFDLRLCGMVIEHEGRPVSLGAGAACMGNPLAALRWLAGTLARAGRPMAAGDVILSGALGPMVAARPGDAFEVRIEGLGSVRTRFSPDTEARP